MGRIKANTVGLSKKRCEYISVAPIPPPPETISAVKVVISDTGSATRSAAKIRGHAAGSTMRNSILMRDVPNDAADQIKTRLTLEAAAKLPIKIGNTQANATSRIFEKL